MKENRQNAENPTDFKLGEGVYLGMLMSPAEVKSATAGRAHAVPDALHRWTLCGDVEPSIFALLQAVGNPQQDNERLTVFDGDNKLHHAVITHQAGYFQHRFLVPLYDARVSAFVRAVAHGDTMGYSLGGQRAHAAVWASRFGMSEFRTLLPMCTSVPVGREREAFQRYVDMVVYLQNPDHIASAVEGLDVKFASVSAVAPECLLQAIAGQRARAG